MRRGRVRTPMPLRGGACGGWYRRALVGLHYHLCGAQQARSAPRRQGAAAGCTRQCPYGGRAGCRYRQALVGLQGHFRGAQQARSAPRTNVRELFCGSKITRNDSDEAERRERSPFGVVSVANGEKLAGAARQVRGASPARKWECFASQQEFRGERGGPDGRSCAPQAGRP